MIQRGGGAGEVGIVVAEPSLLVAVVCAHTFALDVLFWSAAAAAALPLFLERLGRSSLAALAPHLLPSFLAVWVLQLCT